MDDAEADYVIDAIEFIASYGHCFLPQYHFDLQSGSWTHEQCSPLEETLTISAAIEACGCKPTTRPAKERQALYVRYLREAQEWADQLSDTKPAEDIELEGELGELQFFTIKQPDPQLSAGMASGEPVSDID
jgi:hypothetical protein